MATSIRDAAKSGDLEEVKRLIEQDTQLVHSRDDKGYTPLHWASRKGHVEVAARLLGHGANINEKDEDGWTPLLLACGNGPLPLVELLLEKGADPAMSDSFGWTPLMEASFEGHDDVVRCLLRHPKALSTLHNRDAGGDTALYHACNPAGSFDVVEELLYAGADPTMANNNGETPLKRARGYGNYCVYIVELLEEWERVMSQESERNYLLTKVRHLWDASHHHDVSQALPDHQQPSSSSSSNTTTTPTYLMGRVERGEPLPTVEVAGGGWGGEEGDRPVKDVYEGFLVVAVMNYVVCGGLKGELFVELMEEVMGTTGYRKG